MDLTAFMKKYADQITGQYTEYDSNLSIIVVPVAGGRFQTVMGNIKKNELYNRKLITFISKVCLVMPGTNFQMLLTLPSSTFQLGSTMLCVARTFLPDVYDQDDKTACINAKVNGF